MGACDFRSVGYGKTPQEAFRSAVEDAQYEYGHGGYSGTIAEKGSFVLFEVPPRLDTSKLIGWVTEFDYRAGDSKWLKDDLVYEERALAQAKTGKRIIQGRIRALKKRIKDAEREEAKFKREVGKHWNLVKRMSEVFDDKWGPAVAIEVTSPTKKKDYLHRHFGRTTRGQRVFIFCGMASS